MLLELQAKGIVSHCEKYSYLLFGQKYISLDSYLKDKQDSKTTKQSRACLRTFTSEIPYNLQINFLHQDVKMMNCWSNYACHIIQLN